MRFLIVGLGSIGKRHQENLGKVCPSSEISVHHHDEDIDKALSQGYDAVFITNPTSEHIPIALKAAEKGSNLFIEKPVSHNLDGADELLRIVKEKNLIAAVGFNMRFHPAIEEMKKFLPGLGRLYFARLQYGEYLPDWHPDEDYREGYSAKTELGGGALLTLSHQLDYLLWLKGEMPSQSFSMSSRVSNLEIDAEDNVELLLSYNDGFIAEFNMNYLQKQHTRTCQIVGEKGALEWDYYGNTLTSYDNETKEKNIIWNDPAFERNDMYLKEVKHFVDCIKGDKKPLINLEEGLKSLRVILSAKR